MSRSVGEMLAGPDCGSEACDYRTAHYQLCEPFIQRTAASSASSRGPIPFPPLELRMIAEPHNHDTKKGEDSTCPSWPLYHTIDYIMPSSGYKTTRTNQMNTPKLSLSKVCPFGRPIQGEDGRTARRARPARP